jgi:hypothetical protein
VPPAAAPIETGKVRLSSIIGQLELPAFFLARFFYAANRIDLVSDTGVGLIIRFARVGYTVA